MGVIPLTPNALTVLERRYLQKDENGKVIETTAQMFRRIAKGIAEVDRQYGKSNTEVKELENEFYRLMTSLEFVPNSPTLMNMSTSIRPIHNWGRKRSVTPP